MECVCCLCDQVVVFFHVCGCLCLWLFVNMHVYVCFICVCTCMCASVYGCINT